MAERRMFSKSIIDSDVFLAMPMSTQLLYFHLSMRADDDGFVNKPNSIRRMIGASEDDLKVLIAKRYVLAFESGIIVIKHWRMHNYIQKDRYKETTYLEEKSLLSVDNKNAYVYRADTPCIQNVYGMDTQDSIDKDSIDKDSIDNTIAETSSPDYKQFEEKYNSVCTRLPKMVKLTTQRQSKIRTFLKQFTFEDFAKICEIANSSNFLCGNGSTGWKANFDWLINSNNATKVLEGNYPNKVDKSISNYTEEDNKAWF